MKVLCVLILVFLTACNGGQYKHPSQHQVDLVEKAYWKYVEDTTKTSPDHVWEIRHSSIGKYLCSIISQSIDIIYTFFRLVYAQLVTWITNLYHNICQEVDHLHQHLDEFLCHLEADIHYHGKELAAKIRLKFEDIKHCAAHHIEALDPKGLKIALLEKTQELHEYLDKCFEHLHTHHHHPGHHHHHHDHKHHGHHHHHHGHKHPGHHHHRPCSKHPGHHHHHHGHKHPDHHHHRPCSKHPGHHHHGHKHPGHHHHRHHHHGHKHPGHHHHKQEHDVKKTLCDHIEAFKNSFISLVHHFDVKLAHTTEEFNKKHAPPQRKCNGKLVKTSDDDKEYLECLWHDWISFYDKKAH